MRIVKNILIALIVLVVVLAGIGFMLPSAYKIERSVTIAAPADVVFDQVNDLKKNEAWSPWMKNDPSLQITYSGPETGKGATSTWTSKKSGNGSQTITESVPGKSINTYLDFGQMGNAQGAWAFSEAGGSTKVTQSMSGDAGKNPFKHLMNLAMDKMIGKYFEQGLNSLKDVSEKRAAEVQAEQAATRQAAAAPAEEPAPNAVPPAPTAKKP
jgi:ribosome-associated toxin RatA of RatAB toxin-antitoxin module